ncbi:MAG: manganese efflux pump [Pirellulales bacterium]|nr:manganese efflux pump [Pirellulales bacterium]
MDFSWLSILGIAVGLAMDAFAVSVAAGLSLAQVTYRHVFRLAFHFGLFQFLMPILGWLAGKQVAESIKAFDHWIAFGLLAYVGGKMLWEARRDKPPGAAADPTRGLTLVTLSLATSIDALAVGLSMGLLGVTIILPSVVIGVVTATLCTVGILFGARIGSRWGRYAEIAGGIVLIAIGLRIVVTHLGG